MGLAAAVTAAAVDIGIGAATASVIGTVAAGAIVGAGVGTVTSAITGGDLGKGALFGAIGGAVTGGVSSALGDAGSVVADGTATTGQATVDTAGATVPVDTAPDLAGSANANFTPVTTESLPDVTGTVASPVDANAAVNGIASPSDAASAITGTPNLTTTPVSDLSTTPVEGLASTPGAPTAPSGMLGDSSLAGGDANSVALNNATNTIDGWDKTAGSNGIFGKGGWIEQNPTVAKIGAQTVGGVATGLLSENQQSALLKAYTANQAMQQSYTAGNYAPTSTTSTGAPSAFTGAFTPQPAAAGTSDQLARTTFTPSAYGGQWVYSPAAGKVIYQTNPAPGG